MLFRSSLLGRYLAIVHNGNISMREIIPALTKEEKLGGHARRVMESYEKWLIGTPELDIIRMMGLFDRPATGDAIESLKKPPEIVGLTDTQRKLSWAQWKYAVSRLRELGLLGAEDGYHSDILDCHPLVREHFQEKLKNENPNAWIAANSKLYEYYRDIPNKTLPDTLVEMEPLFLAVSHGCKANKYQEAMAVYWERIQRKSEYYSLKVLGALGANLATLADFFDTQWDKPVDNISVFFKLEVLGSAGYILRALGQKQEAIQALRGGLIHSIRFQDRKSVV